MVHSLTKKNNVFLSELKLFCYLFGLIRLINKLIISGKRIVSFELAKKEMERLPIHQKYGYVYSVQALMVGIEGAKGIASIGDLCTIVTKGNKKISCEIISIQNELAIAMAFDSLEGVRLKDKVYFSEKPLSIRPNEDWLGRIVNARGEGIDDKGSLNKGEIDYYLKSKPLNANIRGLVENKIDLGVRAINSFVTCCKGQRLGIFAGSGVGKSTLLSMFAKNSMAEINIIAMVGERGREVREFIEKQLGQEGLSKSIVIVSTSDEPALMRRQAAYLAMTLAEYFRDLGKDVLCFIDSLTRFAMAQREIGLAAGEPPTTKGYTPSVFNELPMLLERSGPGHMNEQGSITGLYTILVDGDDHNEPIADALRGILDGHIVLDRKIAERGRFPAINILKSLSRSMPACNTEHENALIIKARQLLSKYEDMEELIRIGAYKKGSDPEIDQAIFYYPHIEEFLSQSIEEISSFESSYQQLEMVLHQEQPVMDREDT